MSKGMTLEVFVEGMPKGQPRPRAFASGGKARVYDPGTAEGWKAQVALALKPLLPEKPFEGSLFLSLLFQLPRPKSHYTSRGQLRKGAPMYPVGKPDLDNLAKAVMDAMTQIGMWRDDSQVVELRIGKMFCELGGRSGCEIRMWKWQD